MSRILFDQGTPVPLRDFLKSHTVHTAFEHGWATLKNGELLDRAEIDGFEILVTTDRNLRYQQNLSGRRIAIIVLSSTSWPRIQLHVPQIVQAVEQAVNGSFVEIPINPSSSMSA